MKRCKFKRYYKIIYQDETIMSLQSQKIMNLACEFLNTNKKTIKALWKISSWQLSNNIY